MGLWAGSLTYDYVNPGSVLFKLSFVYSFVSQITHLFHNGFQPNLCQNFSYLCMYALPVILLILESDEKGYYIAD